MSLDWTTLFVGDAGWSVGLCDGSEAQVHAVPPPRDPESERDALRAHVDACVENARAAGARQRPLVLGVSSAWCFAATVATDGLMRRQRHEGLVYRLEERLPVDAEAVTAGFITSPERSAALGVAVRTEPVRKILDALDAAGISVAQITPTALLCHDGLRPEGETGRVTGRLVGTGAGSVDVLLLEDARITAWRSVEDDPAWVNAEIGHLSRIASDEPAVEAVCLPDGFDTAGVTAARANAAPPATVEAALGAATLHAYAATRRGEVFSVELARGRLAGLGVWSRIAGPATATMLALVLLMVSVGVLSTWGAAGYQAAAGQAADRQDELFRRVFPDQRVPAAPLSRFRSEATRSRGLAGGDAPPPPVGQVLRDLQSLLAGLPDPTGDRYRLLELRLSESQVYLDGQARSHTAADRVVTGLAPEMRFRFAAPRTQQLSTAAGQGISFTVVGMSPVEATP